MKRIINGKPYDIKSRLGEHYEVFDDRGAFLFSADNYWEVERELEEREVANKPNSMVAFMQANDWLNEEQIMADLKLMDVFKKKVDKLKVTKTFEKDKEMSEDEAHERWG